MAQTNSKIGFGIKLANSATSGGSYTPLAEILDITPPPSNVDSVKVYRSDGPTVNGVPVGEKVVGWIETGDPEVTITYQPAQRATLETLVGVFNWWKVTYPLVGTQAAQGDTDTFYAFIDSLGKETPLKSAMTCKVKFAVSGASTFTEGS